MDDLEAKEIETTAKKVLTAQIKIVEMITASRSSRPPHTKGSMIDNAYRRS